MLKKINNYITFGSLFNGISIISMRFNILPDFVQGFCMGLGIILISIGIYSENHDISKLRNYKRNLFARLLKK